MKWPNVKRVNKDTIIDPTELPDNASVLVLSPPSQHVDNPVSGSRWRNCMRCGELLIVGPTVLQYEQLASVEYACLPHCAK